MYLEINNLNEEELKELNEKFKGRIREFNSIYTEICRIEAICALDNQDCVEKLDKKEYNNLIDEITEEIGYACENNVFQDLCEIADDVAHRALEDK